MMTDAWSYIINLYQGQWHKFFGHPMDAVQTSSKHQPGLCSVDFRCKECGRGFKKQVCSHRDSGIQLPSCRGSF